MKLDVLIFGGGAAGLWLLDELVRRGRRVALLEAAELGRGQTAGSQGIIHGGLKYTLAGLLTRSAANIREMPLVWRECLAGRRDPVLNRTRLRSEFCYLWRTESIRSRLGMIGSRFGLRVSPKELSDDCRPDVLKRCPGPVARLDEQVIAPVEFLADLSLRNTDRLLRIDVTNGLQFETDGPGHVRSVRLRNPISEAGLELQPKSIVLTAGAGNSELRQRVGLSSSAMQRRPLHMLLLRGKLPFLNGHCIDGSRTRVTITSEIDSAGRTIWQVGGQLAEDGVGMDERTLIIRAKTVLEMVIPGLDLSETQGAAYRIDRAEGATRSGRRPENVQLLREGNVITAWPTKLALVPQLAAEIAQALGSNEIGDSQRLQLPNDWPRPVVASAPWETCRHWQRLDSAEFVSERAA